MITLGQPESIVFGNACHWETTLPETRATIVDELGASALHRADRPPSP